MRIVNRELKCRRVKEVKELGTSLELEFQKEIRENIEKTLFSGTGYFSCLRLSHFTENSVR